MSFLPSCLSTCSVCPVPLDLAILKIQFRRSDQQQIYAVRSEGGHILDLFARQDLHCLDVMMSCKAPDVHRHELPKPLTMRSHRHRSVPPPAMMRLDPDRSFLTLSKFVQRDCPWAPSRWPVSSAGCLIPFASVTLFLPPFPHGLTRPSASPATSVGRWTVRLDAGRNRVH